MSHKYLLRTCEAQALVQVLEFPENKWGGKVQLSSLRGIRQGGMMVTEQAVT